VPGSAPRWFTPPKTVIHLGTTDRRDRVERVIATLDRQPILLVVVVVVQVILLSLPFGFAVWHYTQLLYL